MFYPVYENDNKLIVAIFEFTEDDINYEPAPASGSDYDEYVYSDDINAINYVGNFNEWGDYYLEDNVKCNTFYDAQIMLIQWVIK